MKENHIIKAWLKSGIEERFEFLCYLDKAYGEGKKIDGNGLKVLYFSFKSKIKGARHEY